MTKVGRILFEDGIEKGIEKGRELEKRQTAERLLKKGNAMDLIVDATGLTEKEIRKIEENMLVSITDRSND